MTSDELKKAYFLESPWMSLLQLAKYLRVSKETIYRELSDETSKIPKHRLGKRWLFHKNEIDAWIFEK